VTLLCASWVGADLLSSEDVRAIAGTQVEESVDFARIIDRVIDPFLKDPAPAV
jgi:hypothetical protein